MRITHVFHLRSKRSFLFRLMVSIASLYSLFVLVTQSLDSYGVRNLPNSENKQIQDSYFTSEGDVDGRKASLRLNWLKNEDDNEKKRRQVSKRTRAVNNTDKSRDGRLDGALLDVIASRQNVITNFSLIKRDKPAEVTSNIYPVRYTKENVIGRDDLKQTLAKTLDLSQALRNTQELTQAIPGQPGGGDRALESPLRYIFAFRYYEQLAMATNNLVSLASLAKHSNRVVVMPFVNNSRMNGVRYQITRKRKINKFADLSRYIDVPHANATLIERGYSPLVHFDAFIGDCKHRIDVLVHFLFRDENAEKDAINWFRISKATWKSTLSKAAKNNGWIACDFLKNTGMETLVEDAKINRYICVDPEKIRTAKTLEKLVFKNARCVGIFHWKGNGTSRTHFPLPEAVLERIRPSDLRHNHTLINIAREFALNHLKQPFIGVHIRAERHLMWRGIDPLLKCIKKLTRKVLKRKNTFQIKRIFIATDLPLYGSDTFHNEKSRERTLSNRYLLDSLNKPIVFNPTQYGIFDRGEIAIIEMNILSLGESLFTLGGGNFHDWIVDLFLLKNVEDRSLVRRFCLLR